MSFYFHQLVQSLQLHFIRWF